MSHTIIVVVVRVGVATMIQPSVDVDLVLAGYAVFALALAGGATPHEPYGVRNEFHGGTEYRRGRLGARRVGSQVRRAIQIGVGARVEAVGYDAFLMDPERVIIWEFHELPWGVL
jgi:hypothetical protein